MQKRTLATRARLLSVATELVQQHGFAALRTEDIVQRAGVAKGTFFSHFRDKDALMDLLIGAGINEHLDLLEARQPPVTVDEVVDLQLPLLHYMTQERCVFDVILRLSGAAAVAEVGAIAGTFDRYIALTTGWFAAGNFRSDIPASLQVEGMQAFTTQAMALSFCALHCHEPMEERLRSYLQAWLKPLA